MQIKQKVEINFQFTRKNGVADRKKVEIILPRDVVYKLSGQEKGLNVIIPYLYNFIKEGEKITWYNYRILVQDVDAEEKKNAEQKKKELEKQQKEEQKRQQEFEQKVNENERIKKDIEDEKRKSEKEKRKRTENYVTIETTNVPIDENYITKKPNNETKSEQQSNLSYSNNTHNSYLSEKEKIDLEFYKKQKELELRNNIKNQKIENAKGDLESGGNKFVYYLKRFWLFLDKPWKKIVFFIILFYVTIFTHDFFTQSTDKEKLENAKLKFEQIYLQAQNEFTKKNIEKATLLLVDLEQIINNTNIRNEFLIEERNLAEKEWQSKYETLKNMIEKETHKK